MAYNLIGVRVDYRIGTITLTAGSKDFTVSDGANLSIANIWPGETILHPNGKTLVIETVTDATTGTLREVCPDDCAGSVNLTIRYQSDGSRFNAAVRELIEQLANGVLASIAGLELFENGYLRANENGVFEIVDGRFLSDIIATNPAKNDILQFDGTNWVTYSFDPDNFLDMGKMVENKTANNDVGALILTNAERQAIKDNTVGLTYKSSERYNWIINGGLTINQRGVASPRDVASGVYGYDRWKGNTNGLEQVVEALPSSEYTLTWSGGGTGYIGSTSGASPLKATTTGGNVSVVVPKAATNVSLVAGDATKQDPWTYVQRAPAIEITLCQRYYETGVTYQGGWTAQYLVGQSISFKVTKRTTPTLSFAIVSSVNVSNPRAQDPNTNDFSIILDIPTGATVTRSVYQCSWIANAEF